ncbi:putative amine oxidase [copper-containing] [Haliotis rubra]|uniref:putative amine oxidase [copper-containing] n=1 Tax=Haliotis rubra TaxID=36100 RepID=UPI001EE61249|nr:putative amine oxidase [copper-containing] [Haliotis rubra]
MNIEEEHQFRRTIGRWRFTAVVFILISIVLSIFLVAMAIFTHGIPRTVPLDMCDDADDLDVTEADDPGVFDDLTSKELSSVQKYLYSVPELNLSQPSGAGLVRSFVHSVELHVPNKEYVLRYLDENAAKPEREALVLIFRGDKLPPVVEEYIVGALPLPSYLELRHSANRPNPIPFSKRPMERNEYINIYEQLFLKLGSKLKKILEESYEAELPSPGCLEKCLSFYPVPIGSGVVGSDERKTWVVLMQSVEYYTLHPVGLSLLINLSNPLKYIVELVDYGGQRFHSIDEFISKYNSGEVTKHKKPFPNITRDLFSTLYRRGEPVPELPKRPPKFYEPDGKRYRIVHRHVEYMQWKFDFRMSAQSGPQVYDVRFLDERIAYEISLQEIGVFYSGSGGHKFADFIDSADGLGQNSHALVPGVDCPDTSTFVDGFFLMGSVESPKRLPRMFCVFEENTAFPLHRHQSYYAHDGQFYHGLVDSALVLRAVTVIANYDYIVDFVFHQNGALHIRAAATGYIFSSFYTSDEIKYGFRLEDYISGNIHHHMVHFKIDLDIHGTSNRYETLDIHAVEVPNDVSVTNATYWQTMVERKLKESELEAAFRYDFQSPKYHVIHNGGVKTRHGEISGYRLHLQGMSHQPLPENRGNEATASWSRYQLAATKFKDWERESSSCYGMFDSRDPVVNFTSFLADNESIVDEDLVLWASVGIHHIPHTEDLPVTPTVGGHLGIYLLPFNYFQECPSMASRDSVRLELKERYTMATGVRVDGYNNESTCLPKSTDLHRLFGDNAEEMFN